MRFRRILHTADKRQAQAEIKAQRERRRQEARTFADLKSAHERRYSKTLMVSAVAAVGSTFMIAKGIIEKTVEMGVADIIGMGTAILSSAAAGAIIATANMALFSVAMDASRRQNIAVAFLAFALLPPILGVSTLYAVLGNAGAPSLAYDMRDNALELRAYYEASISGAEQARNALDTIAPKQQSLCYQAENERQSGRYTGASGYGFYTKTLDALCVQSTAIVQTLEATGERTNERRAQAMAYLEALNRIPKDQSIGDIFQRQDAFRQASDQLLELMHQSKTENVQERIQAQLTSLQASVSTGGIQQGNLGQRQQALIEDLRRDVGVMATALETLLSDTSQMQIEAPAPLMDMGEAVFFYWQKNIPQFLLALMLDLMSLWFFVMLRISRRIPQHRAEDRDSA